MARTQPIAVTTTAARADRLASRLAEIRTALKTLEEEKASVSGQLLTFCKRHGDADDDGKVRLSTDAYTMQVVSAKHSQISKDKLVDLGVSARIIHKATVETPYEYVLAKALAE